MKPKIVRALHGAGLLTAQEIRDRLRDNTIAVSTVLKYLAKLEGDKRVRPTTGGKWELIR